MMPEPPPAETIAYAASAGCSRGSGCCGQARQRVAVHFAREVVLGRRRRAAVQAHPDAQQRIGEAVALLPGGDQVHVLEPRQVVLRRPRRPLQTLRDFGQRQPFLFAQNLENGLERAVAARAVQAQLVAEAAVLGEPALGRQQRGQRADRVADGRAAACSRIADSSSASARTYAGRPSASACTVRARIVAVGVLRPRPRMSSVSSSVREGMWMTSNRAERSRSSRSVRAT